MVTTQGLVYVLCSYRGSNEVKVQMRLLMISIQSEKTSVDDAIQKGVHSLSIRGHPTSISP